MNRSRIRHGHPSSPPISSRIKGHALRPRAADMRFEARQQIPDLAVDFRHITGRPQHLLQTAFVRRLYLSNLRLDLISIHRIDCVRVIAPEESKMNTQGFSSLRTVVDSERRAGEAEAGSEHVKVRFRRQPADKHGKVSADAGSPFDRNAFTARNVHIERYSSEGWAGSLLQLLQEKCRFLAAFSLQFPCFRRLLVTVALLGNPSEQE